MNHISDRVILLLFILFCEYLSSRGLYIDIALLTIIFCGLSYVFYAGSKFYFAFRILTGLMILIWESLTPLLGLLVYEAVYQLAESFRSRKKTASSGIVLLAVVVGKIVLEAAGYHTYFQELVKDVYEVVVFVLLMMIAAYLAVLSARYSETRKSNLRLRDDGEEFRRLMVQKNELLREKQDDALSMAVLQERNRIAREIHDNVGHLLSRAILQMGALQAVYREEPLADQLKQLGATLDESMNNIRDSVHGIHNESFLLRQAVEKIMADHPQYTFALDYDLPMETPREIKYCFISIVQEAVENVTKHSDADKINLVMREHPAFYQLIIHDNGHPAPITESGIGLHNMESRVMEQNGRISITTERGFRIFITIPKKQEGKQE